MTNLDSSVLISIVIPIGPNVSDFSKLEFGLSLNKKLQNVEFILVVDSADSDITQSVSEIISKLNLRNCKCLRVNFGNPGQTRNFGIEASTGAWIQFWDSDDIGDLNSILGILDSVPAEIVVQQYQKKHLSNETESASETKDIFGLILNPGLWRIATKREFLKEARFPPLSMAEDQVFLFYLLLMNPAIRYVSDLTYTYFIGAGTQLTSQKEKFKDLPLSMAIISSQKFKLSGPKRQYQILFLEKLLLTTLKRATFTESLQSVRIFVRYFFDNLTPKFMLDFLIVNVRLVRSFGS